MSGRSINLTTLFLGRLRPPKRLTSTSRITFASNWQLPLLNQRKEKRKYVARPGIESRTSDLRVRCPTDCATRPGGNRGIYVFVIIYAWCAFSRLLLFEKSMPFLSTFLGQISVFAGLVSWPRGNIFFMLNSIEHELNFFPAHKC